MTTELNKYFSSKYTPLTAKRYLREVEIFITQQEKPTLANLSEITDYIGNLREAKQYKSAQTLQVVLCAIKQYYQFLQDTGIRKDHPCKFLKLKDKTVKDVQLQDLFSTEELAALLQRKERYKDLIYRNKIILSLLIFQGLTTGEIANLQLHHIDLEQTELFVAPSSKLNSRTLQLRAEQVLWFYRYIHEIRGQLLRTETNNLIINKLGNPETGEQISYLVSTFKSLYPERNLNPRTIRQSVITNLLSQGKNLRLVQVFAGHKYPSATERYKQTSSEELRQQILRYHPLG